MKDEALHGIDAATVRVFATQGGKFVLTNQTISLQ